MHKIGRRFYNEGFIWLVLAYIVALIVLDQRGYFLSKVNSISQRINQEAELVVKVEAPLEVKTNRIEFPVSTLISGRKTILLARCYNTKNSVSQFDVLKITGKILPLPQPRNPGQFDYGNYLMRKGYSGIISVNKYEIIKKGKTPLFYRMIDSIRAKMIDSIRKNLPAETPEGGVLEAMFVGEKSEIPPEVSAEFIDSGLMHVLVVSGMNVVYVVAVFFFAFKLLPISNKLRNVFLIVPIVVYCFATGANPPVVRATVLALAIILCYLLSRERALYHAFALSALIILIFDPQALFGASMQLSFAACLGLVYIAPKLADSFKFSLPKILRYILLLFFVTLSAQLATAPLLAKYFYKVSGIGLLSNLVVVPDVGIILWLCFIQFFAYMFFPFALPVTTWACHLSANVLLSMTAFFAKCPFANVYTGAPSLVFIISYYIILIAVFKFKRNLYKLFGLAFLLIFVFFSYKILQSNGKLTVTFLDVGLGDSVFVKTPDNKKIFVDCGGADAGVGKWVYQPFLLSQGITKIDKILITTDKWTHYAGLKGLIEFFKIGEIYLP
ncbi:MAG: ComEC/Rec2 family competence protein, partial [Elusimicrobiota bacterium]